MVAAERSYNKCKATLESAVERFRAETAAWASLAEAEAHMTTAEVRGVLCGTKRKHGRHADFRVSAEDLQKA